MPSSRPTDPEPRSAEPRWAGFGFAEFVALTALLMAIPALSIDIMLPSLPDIAGSYAVDEPNHRQFIVTAYLVGFAVGQPFYGPLSDRFGRKPMLLAGLLVFAAGSLGALAAPSFGALLAARALQGLGGAAPRVIALALVRDRFSGARMAEVMSMAMMVFILVPVFAPSVGGGLAAYGGWPWSFGFLLLAAAVALAWSGLRLPETLRPEDRRGIGPRALSSAFAAVVTARGTVGYGVAAGFLFGCLMSYVGSAQQIFTQVYGQGDLFPVLFGALAGTMAFASLANARLVGRVGMRRLSHLALLGFVSVGWAMAAASLSGHLPLPVFAALQAGFFFFFGLIMPNFNALAMQPVGHVAGTASSFLGFYTTIVGALLGWAVGQSFDGTVFPLSMGYAVLGTATLATVIATERGRLALTPARA
jgi:DHA1 family bicyclomycin/chloramphenicol resistance-like MFS transporter